MSTMTTSSHERYRDALTALAGDTAILPIVSAAGERRGWWTSERQWRRTFGRFLPDAGTLARLVVMSETPFQEICRIEIFERRPGDDGGTRDACDVETDLGWARATRFPFDPALPALAPLAARATVVRYHPGKRCTLRRVTGERGVFAKVFAASSSTPVYQDLVALQRVASKGEVKVRLAEPLSWDASARTLWQAALPGQPATRGLCGRHGDDLARRMGMGAASLTRANVTPSVVFDGAAQLARSRRHAGELARRVPALSGMVTAIVDCLAGLHARWPSHDLRPIHGAPHTNQWLDAGSGIGLIDFDRFGAGDPEMDAGVVLANFEALDEPAVPLERLAAAFLEGYRAASVTLREPLVRAYRAHQHLAKALHAAQAIRPDGDRRAARAVARTDHLLRDAVVL
jgi:hypothetical protein